MPQNPGILDSPNSGHHAIGETHCQSQLEADNDNKLNRVDLEIARKGNSPYSQADSNIASPEIPENVNESLEINLCIAGLELTAEGHPEKPIKHYHTATAFLDRFHRLGNKEDLQQAITHYSHAVDPLNDQDLNKSSWCDGLGKCYQLLYGRFDHLDALDSAIVYHQRAIDVAQSNHADESAWHNHLGNALCSRFKRLGSADDMGRAMAHHRQAMDATPDDHSRKPAILNNFANCLQTRFESFGDIEDIQNAIAHHRRAVDLTLDGDEGKSSWLKCLGDSLLDRFEWFDDIKDLREALINHSRALEMTPDGHLDKPSMHSSLGTSYAITSQRLGRLFDINQAIFHHQKAVDLTLDDDPDKAVSYNNVGNSLLGRFERLGTVDDLNQAVRYHQLAFQKTPDGHLNRASWCNNLGSTYHTRFEYLGQAEDLNQAVIHHQLSVDLTPEGHPDRPIRLSSLGSSLRTRFERFKDVDDLNRAVSCHQQAVDLTPSKHPDKPSWHNNLGNTFEVRFKWLGSVHDLHQAVLHHQHAVNLTPEGHPDKPAWHNNLGNAFRARFQRLGDADDIRRSISQHEFAVDGTTDERQPRTALFHHNLGTSYRLLFDRIGDKRDLQRAISQHQRAVNLTPVGHPDKASRHSSLGGSFLARFQNYEDVGDLDKAVEEYQVSRDLIPEGHHDKHACLNNLGISLYARFEKLRDEEDIQQAVLCQSRAVDLMPDKYPLAGVFLLNLALSLSTRGWENDLTVAVSLCISAAITSYVPPDVRFEASTAWAQYLYALQNQLPPLFDACQNIIELLPRLSWSGVNIATRLSGLWKTKMSSPNAVAVALSSQKPEIAVEWFEYSRSVVWNQILEMRTPLDSLAETRPDLAKRLGSIWGELNEDGHGDDHGGGYENYDGGVDMKLERRIELVLESEQIIEEAGRCPGLERFLLPKEYDELRLAARTGPIVLLNASHFQCDALILMSPTDLRIVRLDRCEYAMLRGMQSLLRKAVDGTGQFARDYKDLDLERAFGPTKRVRVEKEDVFRDVVHYLWGRVVEPCLSCLRGNGTQEGETSSTGQNSQPTDNSLLYVRWCPSGPFVFLPIHAATKYNADGTVSTRLTDHAISSYITTLGSLIKPKKNSQPAAPSLCKALVVVQSKTPNQAALPGARKELEKIRLRATKVNVGLDSLVDEAATVDKVVTSLTDYSILHFACHGVQDLTRPLHSGLLLHDGRLTLSQLMYNLKTKNINKDSAARTQLAFLSACETAMGDEELPNESVHLAAGMLFGAGFGDVVATLWVIGDRAAPVVADGFYKRLFGGVGSGGARDRDKDDGNITWDSKDVAVSLHYAVQDLIAMKPDDFMSWMPFVHISSLG